MLKRGARQGEILQEAAEIAEMFLAGLDSLRPSACSCEIWIGSSWLAVREALLIGDRFAKFNLAVRTRPVTRRICQFSPREIPLEELQISQQQKTD